MVLKIEDRDGKQENMSVSTSDQEIDISQIIMALWRGKIYIFCISIFCMTFGGWYAYKIATPVYTASSVVALESREQSILDIDSVVSGLSGDQASINTEVEVLRSRVLIERLVRDLNLLEDPEFNNQLGDESIFSLRDLKGALFGEDRTRYVSDKEELDSTIDSVLEALQVSNVRQSYVFRITFTTRESKKSAQLANKLSELYIEDQIRVKSEKTRQATIWLSDRVSELKRDLEVAEEEVEKFKATADIFNSTVLNARNLQIKELRERRDALEEDRAFLIQKVETLEAALAAGQFQEFAYTSQDETIRKYVISESAPDLIVERGEEIIDILKGDLEIANNRLETVNRSISTMTSQVARQGGELVEMQQLEREAEASRLIYEAFLSRLKEASIQQGIQQADSRILSMAVVPRSPSAPRKTMILAISTFFGLAIGAFFTIFNESKSKGYAYRTAEDLENDTGYAVLGRVPTIPRPKEIEHIKLFAREADFCSGRSYS